MLLGVVYHAVIGVVVDDNRGEPSQTSRACMHARLTRSVLHRGELPLSMAQADSGDVDAPEREIRLLKNPDGQWTARDLRVGVTAQGDSQQVALENLDAVVAAVDGEGGHSPTDEEIRELGVDPESARSQDDELPDVLQ